MRKRFNPGNFMFNLLVVSMLMLAGLPAVPVLGASVIAGTALSYMKAPGVVMAGIQKEIWTDIIMEGFYPKDDFLSWSRDMSELVEFNTLNLAEAGADPALLIDNDVYPISAGTRTDTPKTIVLRTLDTESTIVRNLEKMESSYNKMESVVRGHRNALRKGSIQLAAHFWAPQANGAYTPVLAATGAVSNGRNTLLFEDILSVRAKLVALDVDISSMAMMLNPLHEADLLAQDMKLYKEMLTAGSLWGIKLFTNSQTPRFNATTGAKVAFQAAPAVTDTIASILWSRDEVMRADGTVDVFAKYNDPDQKGDVINFQKRFVALPFRSKIQAAIYSPLEAGD
jgi:hypothetical protein